MADIDALIARHESRLAEHRRQLETNIDAAPSSTFAGREDQFDFLPNEPSTPQQQQQHHQRQQHSTTNAAKPQPWSKSTAHAHTAAVEVATPRSSTGGAQRLGGNNTASPARSVSSSNLRANGDYVVDSPTSLYDRTLRWASNRDKAVARQASEKDEIVLQDCTFRPQVSRAPSTAALTPKRAASRSAPSAAATNAAGDAASFHLHIQRQEGARRDKIEAKKRIDVDISHWEPRVTTPKEFSFAQRQGHITSLRKPVYRVDGLLGDDDDDDQPSTRSAAAANRGGGQQKPSSPTNTGAQPATARRAKTPSQRTAAPPQQHDSTADDIQLSDDDGNNTAALTEQLREANAKIAALTRDLHASRSRHAVYEEEIAALKGTNIGLRRELEAAKNMLRQKALSHAHSL